MPGLAFALLLILGTATAPRTSVATPLFHAPFLWYDGGEMAAAIGDINRDGRPDLVLAGGDGVTVLLSNEDGTLGGAADYPTGPAPCSPAIADINGDGRPDVVVVNSQANSISILLGNADGTLGTKYDFATGPNPRCAVVVDVNGDGNPDVVVANLGADPVYAGSVSVLLNGSFGTRKDFATGGSSNSVAVGDWNDDGKPDLAVANGSGDISVLLNDGAGNFTKQGDYPTSGSPGGIAEGDLNGDGRLDLVTSDWTTNQVSVLLGLGGGSFATHTDFPAEQNPTAVAVADLNRDGRLDVIVIDSGPATVSVYPGNGDGTLGPRTNYRTAMGTFGMAVGDLNADGAPDLAVVSQDVRGVAVFMNRGDGTFPSIPEYAIATRSTSLAVADLDRDGRADVVVASAWDSSLTGSPISVLLGRGDGTLGPKTDFYIPRDYHSLAVGDLNGDGIPDLAVTSMEAATVLVLPGHGDGTFGAGISYATDLAPCAVAIGDMDGDHVLDLAVANRVPPTSQGPRPGSVSILLNHGDGTFAAKRDFTTSVYPYAIALGDLDGDGDLDVVTPSYAGNVVDVLLGNGDGTLGAAHRFPVQYGPNAVAIGDMNGDGRPDLLVTNGVLVSILPGLGGGGFGTRTDFNVGEATSVAASDLDGDGSLDLVLARRGGVSVLLGDGHGHLGAETNYGAGIRTAQVAISDLNGDQRPDVVALNSGGYTDWHGTLSVLLNTGGEIPTPTMVALVNARAEAGRVVLSWFGSGMASVPSVVHRCSDGTSWSGIADIVSDGSGWFRYEDSGVSAGTRYGYRLGIVRNGKEQLAGETWITVPDELRLALDSPSPNPTCGGLTISFMLPIAAPARLEVLDVAGRQVAVREVGSLGAGRHVVSFVNLADRRPGIYVVRLTQGTASIHTKACLLR